MNTVADGSTIVQSFTSFEAYATALEDALRSYSLADLKAVAEAALDGMPARILRSTVSTQARRVTGTFFSGRELATRLVEPYRQIIREGTVVADPACGAGDLLLAAAQHLPHTAQFGTTATKWSRQLLGFDLDPAFARVARARLLLLLQGRRAASWKDVIRPDRFFHQIEARDSLANKPDLRNAGLLLLNPPFGTMPAPAGCKWGSGVVARAAVFAEASVEAMPVDSQLALILPDVLRSGTRYAKWRAAMDELMTVGSIEVVGRFDRWADVDVFIMRGQRTAKRENRKRRRAGQYSGITVDDLFIVSVGAVVPHRDPKTGPTRAFLHAKGLPRFTTVTAISEQRSFEGTVVTAPFVAIRRTSRPGDNGVRAIATIISVPEPVAVENHLIVAQPRDGRIESCEALLRLLQSPYTTRTLNRQTRCRHLSIRFIKALRWREVDSK